MPNPNVTEIAVVLDRSGSMAKIRDDMEGGLKAFVDGHRGQPGECLFSLYQFDDRFEVVYEAKPITDVQELTLVPRGSTALLDSLGKTLALITERHAKLADVDKPAGVLVLVITDGHENASHEWTLANVRAAIERAEKDLKWRFVFLGADTAAFDDARSMGITTAAQYTPSARGVIHAYKSVLDASVDYRTNVSEGHLDAIFAIKRDLTVDDDDGSERN